jgi:hypothetical protein
MACSVVDDVIIIEKYLSIKELLKHILDYSLNVQLTKSMDCNYKYLHLNHEKSIFHEDAHSPSA